MSGEYIGPAVAEVSKTDMRLHHTTYRCPKHGQRPLIGFQYIITVAGEPDVRRNYCDRCFIEMLDKLCCQLVEEPAP